MLYIIIVKDLDYPKESARARATRKWHNNHVIRHINKEQEPQATKNIPIQSKAYKEILKIITEKDDYIMRNYIISIRERHIKLLKEKLRRLRAENKSE
jgi:hypothetical protein